MFTSCGIQWLAQAARYLSQAQRYLKGTSWLTSEEPLITRLSSIRTRRKPFSIACLSTSTSCTGSREKCGDSIALASAPEVRARFVSGAAGAKRGAVAGAMSSSKLNMFILSSAALGCRDAPENNCGWYHRTTSWNC